MITAFAVLYALLQAEPAPPEPAADPAFAHPAVAMPEADPAATSPGPTSATPGTAPTPATQPARLKSFSVGLIGRLGVRLGPGSDAIGPRFGYSVGIVGEYVYLRMNRVELGAGVDLLYDQFSQGDDESYHVMSHTSFVALQKLAVALGFVRPWVAGGIGGMVGYFHSDETRLSPGNQTTGRFLLRAGAGVDFQIRPDLAITARADYSWLLSRPTFTTDAGETFQVFSDLLDVGGGILYRF